MADLSGLQLNENAEKIYRVLLVSGQLSKGEIRTTTKIHNDELNNSLLNLIEKKLVRKIPGLEDRFACLLPVGPVKEELEKSITEISNLSNQLRASSSNVISKIKTEFESSAKQFNDQLSDQETQLSQQITDVDGEISKKIQEITGSLSQKVDTLKENQHQQTLDLGTKTTDQVNLQTENAISAINTRLNSIDENINKTKEEQSLTKAAMVSKIPNLDSSQIDAVLTDTNGLSSNIESKLKEHIHNIRDSTDNSLTSIHGSIKEQIQVIQSSGNQFTDAALLELNNFRDTVQNLNSQQQEQLENLNLSVESTTAENLGQVESLQTSINSILDNQIGVVNQTHQEFTEINELNVFLQKTDELQANLKSYIEESATSTNAAIYQIKESFDNAIQSETTTIVNNFKEHLELIISNTESKISALKDDFTNQLSEMTTTLLEDQNEKKVQINQKLDTEITNLKSSFSSSIQSRDEQFKGLMLKLTELSTQGKEGTNQGITEISNSLGELAKAIKLNIENTKTSFLNITGTTNEHIKGLEDSNHQILQTNIVDAFTRIGSLIEEKASQLKTLNTSNSTALQESLSTSSRELADGINQRIEGLKESIANNYDTTRHDLISTVDTFHTQYEELLSKSRTSIVGSVKQVERDTQGLKENLLQTVQQTLETINQQIDMAADNLMTDTSEVMTFLQTEASSLTSNVQSTISTSLNQVRELSSSGIEKQVSVAQSGLAEFQTNYDTTSSVLIDNTMALAKVLGSIFDVQEEASTPTIKTTSIIGREPILSFMSDVIKRVKSKITILVPEVKMIDEELILGMKSTSQVTIISNIDEVADDKWIDRMHKASANVTLRSIQKSGFGAEMPNFIGCEREGEEILVGTIDEGNNDYIAIASASEYFVKLFGGTIISDYARGRSVQLKK